MAPTGVALTDVALTDVAAVAVLALVGLRLVGVAGHAVRAPLRARVVALWKGLRPRHLLPVPVVLTAVVAAATALVQVPGLDVGGWTAIGGYGNPITGGTEQTTGTPLEVIVPLVFVVLLLPGLPLFAAAEERMFRLGAEGWSAPRRIGMGLLFRGGPCADRHPPRRGLALSIGGWWFTAVYLWGFRRGGRARAHLESTLAHLAYNAWVLAVLVASLAFLL